MTSDHGAQPTGWLRWSVLFVFTVGLAAIIIGACGSGSASTTPDSRGRTIANENGCAACHGTSFGGGVGPSWVGLAGSVVSLADGTTTVADAVYLTRAIKDPNADKVEGFGLQMPTNSLSDADIAELVTFIQSLADP